MAKQPATTADHKPINEYEALMITVPHEEPYEERAGLTELQDLVNSILCVLPPRERWIVDAIINENKSLQDIADELGYTKTHIWRLRNQAFETLRKAMTTDATIRKYVRLANTWDESAKQWIDYLQSDNPDVQEATVDDLEAYRDAASDIIMSDIKTRNLEMIFVRMAQSVIIKLKNTNSWDGELMLETLCAKQHDYGHNNINRYGLTGLIIRLSDKVERYKNLLGKEARNESTHDTLVDIVGYCVVSLMLIDETFQLHLGESYAQ